MRLEKWATDEIIKWGDFYGSRSKVIASTLNRPRDEEVYQIAGILEDDIRWVKAKINLQKKLNDDGINTPKSNSKLRTQIGRIPKVCGYIHVNRNEKSLPDRSKKFALRVIKEMTKLLFRDCRMNSEAGMMLPTKLRDPRSRIAAVSFFFTKLKHPLTKFQPHRLKELSISFLKHGPFMLIFQGLNRRQPDPFGKNRPATDGFGNETQADPQINIEGIPMQACRFREPQALDGRINLPYSLIVAAELNYHHQTFSNIYKHNGPEHVAAKHREFDEQAMTFWPSEELEFWSSQMDAPSMEKGVTSDFNRLEAEEFDIQAGIFGNSWLFLDAPGLTASGSEGSFATTHLMSEINYYVNRGTGNRSGWSKVVTVGRKAMMSAILEVIATEITDWNWSVEEFNSGPRIRIFNSVDDTKIRGALARDKRALLGKTFQCQGLELHFEEGDGFLKVEYPCPEPGKCEPFKNMDSFFSNLLVSEAGLKLITKNYWVRTGNKTKVYPAGLGALARLYPYNLGGFALKYWEYIVRMLWDEFKMHWWQAFPITRDAFELLLGAVTESIPAYDAWDFYMNVDPDIIYKGYLTEEIPEELADRLFIRFNQERFAKLTRNQLPLDTNESVATDLARVQMQKYPYAELGKSRFEITDYIEKQYDIIDRKCGFVDQIDVTRLKKALVTKEDYDLLDNLPN
jgi:hypothetical protein